MLSDTLKCKDVQSAEVFLKELERKGATYLIYGAGNTELHCASFKYCKIKKDLIFEGTIEITYYEYNHLIKIAIHRNSLKRVIVEEALTVYNIISIVEEVYNKLIDSKTGELKSK